MTGNDPHVAHPPDIPVEVGRVVGRGHPIGDFLEAWRWDLVGQSSGHLRISAHLPEHVCNYRGHLFGGFTATYVDLVAIFTVRSASPPVDADQRTPLATINMSIEYLAPITGPEFVIDAVREVHRGRSHHLLTRFYQDDALAVLAKTTINEIRRT